ncbi:MAG: DUF5685 family protein [Planctomycetaceae bacterium]
MFGFLKPTGRISAWRQSYARVCQTQRRLFGLTSLPFLSYEATFLYQLAVDTKLIPTFSPDAPECCRLRRLRNPEQQPDTAVAEFCAAFGMLLAGVKLQDDADDHGRWHNRFALWKYAKQVQAASQYLEGICHGLTEEVQTILRQHKQSEMSQTAMSVEDYCRPTGDGFALLFRSLAALAGGACPLFDSIGRHVGHAIISWDCAVDFHKDQIYGEFNPLKSAAEADDSLRFCLLELAKLGWALPAEDSVCSNVIQSVSRRVHSRLHRTDNHVCRTSMLERWGLVRAKGYQYARCDGCEICAVAECGECGCAAVQGAAEGASCCLSGSPGSPCCCDALCCWGSGCGSTEEKKKEPAHPVTDQPSLYEQFHGRDGIAYGDLNPQGFVMIDEQRLPGRADGSSYIADRTKVRVVKTDPMGVTVRVITTESGQTE